MSHTRAERRHHRNRLIAKRLEEERSYRSSVIPLSPKDLEAERLRAIMRARTGRRCSCTLCATPRKLYGNSAHAKTRQELYADLNAIDTE